MAETITPTQESIQGKEVPIFQRFMLTPKEASLYFHIGEKKIKAIAAEHPDASFVVYNGSHLLIIRGEFEKFLCNTSSI